MKKGSNNKRTEEILSGFDGIQPSEVPPFFYTRLEARMQRELEEKTLPVFFLRPAFLTLSLSFVLVMNIIFLTRFVDQTVPSSNKSNTTTGIQSFADAYNLSTSSVYE